MDKKRLIQLSVITVVFALLLGGVYVARASAEVAVYVNKQQVEFPDQNPFIDRKIDRVYVPLRFVSEALNGKVDWNADQQMAIVDRSGMHIEMKIGSDQPKVNNIARALDAPARLLKGRTMVPLRFVSEAMGAKVLWEDGNVYITDELSTAIEEKGEPVSVEEVGQPMLAKEWDGYIYRWINEETKILYITMEDLKKQPYQLSSWIVYDLKIDDQHIYVSQQNSEGSTLDMILAEGSNISRYRMAEYFRYPPGTFEGKYSIINDRRDKYSSLPTCDITKVTHIILTEGQNMLAIKNPRYKGGE
jgi:hypothetical protein